MITTIASVLVVAMLVTAAIFIIPSAGAEFIPWLILWVIIWGMFGFFAGLFWLFDIIQSLFS